MRIENDDLILTDHVPEPEVAAIVEDREIGHLPLTVGILEVVIHGGPIIILHVYHLK